MLSGIAVLESGELRVRVDEHRERLLAIKRGETPWVEVDRWRLDLHHRFEQAFSRTVLPEQPDYRAINDYLIRARRLAAEEP
jgi:hypothetical protein